MGNLTQSSRSRMLMARLNNDNPASLGVLGTTSVLSKAPIYAIFTEWAGLLPLACHLTSDRHDHYLLGNVALAGQLPASLFARLGTIEGFTRLLTEGAEFLDRASVVGRSCSNVWDVNWGSTFPCANGAASTIIAGYALKREQNVINVSELSRQRAKESSGSPRSQQLHEDEMENSLLRSTSDGAKSWQSLSSSFPPAFKIPACPHPSEDPRASKPQCTMIARSQHRRYQRLNVLHFARTKPSQSRRTRMKIWEIAPGILFLPALAVLLLYGLYGTAAALASGLFSKAASYLIRLERPNEYLSSNEAHEACMLVGIHSNCSTWYLYTGDRGVVDGLLNKSMIRTPPSNYSPKSLQLLIILLRIGHVFHFLSITFVAAQKGWDGVAMVLLMLSARAIEWFWNDAKVAQHWLDVQGVKVEARRFDFEGRMQMVGAIQALSSSEDISWMDPLISPNPRRTALFSRLRLMRQDPAEITDETITKLNLFDRNWVFLQAELVSNAASVMLDELGHARSND